MCNAYYVVFPCYFYVIEFISYSSQQFVFVLFSERRSVSQDVTLDLKIGIEAKNYEGVSIVLKELQLNILYNYNFISTFIESTAFCLAAFLRFRKSLEKLDFRLYFKSRFPY